MMKKFAILGVFFAYALASASAYAAVYTWSGKGSGSSLNNWNAQQNWDIVPNSNQPPAIGDDAVFGTVAAGNSTTPTIGTVATPANGNIGSIAFNSGAAAFTIAGTGTLNFGSGGITQDSSVDQTLTVSTINLGANTLTVGGSGSGNISIASAITGTGGITKNGNNTLTLSGTGSTYSGATLVGGGTLVAQTAGALGNSSSITVAPLATLRVDSALSANSLALGGTLNFNTPVANGIGIFQNFSVTSADAVINLAGTSASATVSLGNPTLTSGSALSIVGWGTAPDARTGASIFLTGTVDPSFVSAVTFNIGGTPTAATLSGSELVPVPEPEVYAAMFALGLLGFAIARRRLFASA